MRLFPDLVSVFKLLERKQDGHAVPHLRSHGDPGHLKTENILLKSVRSCQLYSYSYFSQLYVFSEEEHVSEYLLQLKREEKQLRKVNIFKLCISTFMSSELGVSWESFGIPNIIRLFLLFFSKSIIFSLTSFTL